MSKKQRLKKEIKLTQKQQERAATRTRYSELMKPTYKLLRKAIITCLLTVVILVIGVQINDKLPEITRKLLGES
ncbi:hypothetical protein HY844_00305 [Candidatus Berkelbacteria bacterium]|nr:hypothetical protein [Candidatus Berkelbacteria bacterium]